MGQGARASQQKLPRPSVRCLLAVAAICLVARSFANTSEPLLARILSNAPTAASDTTASSSEQVSASTSSSSTRRPTPGEFDDVKFPPETVEQAAEEFGGVSDFCNYWGWQPLAPGAPRPRIWYGTIVGNNGQIHGYEAHFVEVAPFVTRIVAVDPRMTQRGHPRNLSLDMSLPNFRRFGTKLRHVVLESLTPGKSMKGFSDEDTNKYKRKWEPIDRKDMVIERWTRAQMDRGFKDPQGNWEMSDADIVIVADSDEIVMRYTLAALQLCEVPEFTQVRQNLEAGKPADEACAKAKVILGSQVYEYFMDCPTKFPLWWHPDAIPASCVMHASMDFEDVRTSVRVSSGKTTKNIGARHVHNLGMSPADVTFKYSHYAEPRTPNLDAGLAEDTIEEMMWRGCDPLAPDIGPGKWYMKLRPSNEFVRSNNGRGYSTPEAKHRGLELPLSILKERPELADRFFWKGHAEKRNPFVGKPGGTNYFDH